LKAVAIYRENSKAAQPLTTQKTEGEIIKKEKKTQIERKKLASNKESPSRTSLIFPGMKDTLLSDCMTTTSREIFVTMHKQGSTIRGLIDAWATTVSLNLQYGASVKDLFNKFRHQKFEPSGFVKKCQRRFD